MDLVNSVNKIIYKKYTFLSQEVKKDIFIWQRISNHLVTYIEIRIEQEFQISHPRGKPK